jgi:hypothetical protein
MIFYLLQLASHPVTVVGRLVQKKGKKQLYTKRNNIQNTTKNTEHTKWKAKHKKQEKIYKKDTFKIHKTIN